MRERRPTRSPSSQPSRALRTTAWRAAIGVKPSSCSAAISASCQAPSGRGSRNSPSTVSSVERAAGAPTERRRRTSSTSGDASARVDGLARARRRHGRGRLHGHLGRGQRRDRRRPDHLRRAARAARDARRSTSAGRSLVPGYIEPHTHPWCLYSPTSLLEVAVPDGTTTLVYDNLFFFLAHGVDGLRTIVDAMNARARARQLGRADRAAVGVPDEAERFATDDRRADAGLAGGRGERRDHELDRRSRRATRGVAAGIAAAKAARKRVEGHNAGASYNRLNELSARRHLRRPRGDHRRPRRSTGCGWACGRCCASPRCAPTSRRCCASCRRDRHARGG